MGIDLLSDILQKLDPVQIIGEYLQLRQSGRSLKALCPFHNEKTPSFHLNPENGLWYCFGCGAGGNLFQFLMKIENLNFSEAKEALAKKAGVTLNPVFEAQSKRKSRLRQILEKTVLFYQKNLHETEMGKQGLHYLEQRGLTGETIRKFQIGMSPSSGSSLCEWLLSQHFVMEEIREAGLASRSDPPRDYFHNRIMFPIFDATGSPIGFGGRTQGTDQPKYLNSPDNSLFKKGENLYGLNLAKNSIAKSGYAILAEGYMDVIMLHQHGFHQAAASLGTSLTFAQARLLNRYVNKVSICYDGDAAGMEAMRRAMGVIQGTSLEMALIVLPQGEDPDTFLKNQGPDAFKVLLEKGLSPVDFAFRTAIAQHDAETPEGKKKIVNHVLPLLKAIADPIVQDAYIKKIGEELKVAESSIKRLLRTKSESLEISIQKLQCQASRENEILRWILWEPALAAAVWQKLVPEDFQEEICRQSAEALYRLWKEGKKTIREVEEIEETVLLHLSGLSAQPPVGKVEVVESLIKGQKERNLKKELEELKQDVSRRLKEGKLQPTDEAYRMYLSLLKKVKGVGAEL